MWQFATDPIRSAYCLPEPNVQSANAAFLPKRICHPNCRGDHLLVSNRDDRLLNLDAHGVILHDINSPSCASVDLESERNAG